MPPTNALQRKVLDHEDFGVCICLPKTHWDIVGPPGSKSTVLVDGSPCDVVVHGEQCNCRGTTWHEHRFLSLPRSAEVAPGQRVIISPASDQV